QHFARLVENPRRGRNGLPRLEYVWAVLADGEEPDRIEPHLHQFLRPFHRALPGTVAGRGKSGDDVALLATQKLIDGNTKGLALDVMQRDVDGRDRRLQDATTLEILAAIDLLPDPTDLHRVLTDQEFTEMFDGPDHRLFAAG